MSLARVEEIVLRPIDSRVHRGSVVWFDDLESGAPGWTHGDFTVGLEPEFHVDTYRALGDSTESEDFSWWCGELNGDFAGGDGYGDSWDERLELPPVSLGGVVVERTTWGAIKGMYLDTGAGRSGDGQRRRAPSPVLTFSYRHDTEPGYDFVWVEVESLGTWKKLNDGFSGSSGGWQHTGPAGYPLSGYGDPVRVRFRFVSDGAASDEDGSYDSDAGAFHVDDIEIADALTGEVFFYDDCDGGKSNCTAAPHPVGGDYWHLATSRCQSYNGETVWRIAWPDSSTVQPNLRNWLQTPVVDISGYSYVRACTVYAVFQYFMTAPPSWSAYWKMESTIDGGATWTPRGAWGGHQWTAGLGPCEQRLLAIPVINWVENPSGRDVAARFTVYTTEDCELPEPDAPYESAGITIGSTWIEIEQHFPPPPTRRSQWDSIKALYR